ncbi:MAG: hypothetical protein L0228_05770 [Planctomycetes bacterium]|nr:hypothetical protein [Planctomycetota bacterium]
MLNATNAVAELYRVFAKYRVGEDFVGFDHYIEPARSKYLLSKPLKELTAAELDSYAFKAISTWGDVDHFKHFLPRLFELVLTDDLHSFLSVEVMFGKLHHGQWTDWPPDERQAVMSYLLAFWCAQLQRDVHEINDDTIDTALCAVGNACNDLRDFLAIWMQQREAPAIRQLAQFILINADTILKKRCLWNAYWETRPSVHQVLGWIASDEVSRQLRDCSDSLSEHLTYAPFQLEAIKSAIASTPMRQRPADTLAL